MWVVRIRLEVVSGRRCGCCRGERERVVWMWVRGLWRWRQRLVHVLQALGQLSGGCGCGCCSGRRHGRRRRPVARGGRQRGRFEHSGPAAGGLLFVRLVVHAVVRLLLMVLLVVMVMVRRRRRRRRRHAARVQRRAGGRAARFALVMRDRGTFAPGRRPGTRAHDGLDGKTDFWFDDHRRRCYLYHFRENKRLHAMEIVREENHARTINNDVYR